MSKGASRLSGNNNVSNIHVFDNTPCCGTTKHVLLDKEPALTNLKTSNAITCDCISS